MTDTTVPAVPDGTEPDDEVLLAELRRVGTTADPLPDGWRSTGHDAFAWAAIEGDVARLVYDSQPAGRGRVDDHGSRASQRSLRYTAGVGSAAVTVEIDLDLGVDKARVTGRVRPVVPHAVVAITAHGRVAGDLGPSGAYRLDELPRRPFCLVVTSPGASVKTGWVVG